MAVKTQIPTSNIHDYDIIDTLNANGGKVSSWTGMFKAAANINPDSKHKPVVLDETFVQDFDSSAKHYFAGWWKADDGMCGYSPLWLQNKLYSSVVSLYDGKRNGWEYVPPYGKGVLRQNDFAGYYPAARPMFNSISAPSEITKDDTECVVTLSIPSDDGKSLNITDFDELKEYYFGVLLYKSDTDNLLAVADSPIKSVKKVSLDPSVLTRYETYKVYPLLYYKKITQIADQSRFADCYTIPNVKPINIYVTGITVDFGYSQGKTWAKKYTDSEGNHFVEYYVAVSHDSDQQMTISSGNAVLRYENGNSVSTDNFLTSSVNIPANTWKMIGERRGDEGIPIDESLYNTPLELYIGVQSNQYGVVIPVEEEY